MAIVTFYKMDILIYFVERAYRSLGQINSSFNFNGIQKNGVKAMLI